jgi:hypothetical protein
MSNTVTESMVQQFGTNFRILGQQKPSRLARSARWKPASSARRRLSSAWARPTPTTSVSRHADTKYVDTPHSRRWLDLQDKAWADLVDELDKIKLLADPTSPYAALGVAALNRAKDDRSSGRGPRHARAALAHRHDRAAHRPEDRGRRHRPHAGQAAQREGNPRRRRARRRQCMDGQGNAAASRVIAVSATKQLTNLLGTTEIKSIDYNNVKALAQGRSTRSSASSSSAPSAWRSRAPPASARRGCAAAWPWASARTFTPASTRCPDKNYSVQVYARESLGAVRTRGRGRHRDRLLRVMD